MAKDKIAFVCSNCGQESAKWMGKCPSCGQWNTFKEIRIAADSGSQAAKNAGMTMRHGGAARQTSWQPHHDAWSFRHSSQPAIRNQQQYEFP